MKAKRCSPVELTTLKYQPSKKGGDITLPWIHHRVKGGLKKIGYPFGHDSESTVSDYSVQRIVDTLG
ncbi:MAG: hypothetical protein CVU41_07485 [Chloroflexi bacterium HGW-Chloroflexi-3]|nr:MAG: hypothetical protein CVU41_07485 [Chloroflexi bacterium HGW-Chloroflexi-3]